MVGHTHIPHELLTRYLQGETAREENRWIVRHLLAGCTKCHDLSRQVISLLTEEGRIQQSDFQAIDRSLQGIMLDLYALERKRQTEAILAESLWARIREMPSGRQLLVLKSSKVYWNLGFFKFLLNEAQSVRSSSPRDSLELAALALALVELLPEEDFSDYFLYSLRAEAFTAIGNYHRILGDLQASQDALEKAEQCIGLGVGDVLAEANHASIFGSLLRDLGDFENAAKSVRQAIRLYHSIDETVREAESWISLATILKYLNPDAGITAAETALQLCEDQRLVPFAAHAKIDCLLERGFGPAAFAEFTRHREALYALQGAKTRNSVKFLAGRIAAAVGYKREALKLLSEVALAYEKLSLYQEQSFAELNIVWLLVQNKKWRAAERLAASTIRRLESLGLQRDALAAWISVRDAIERHALEYSAISQAARLMARRFTKPIALAEA